MKSYLQSVQLFLVLRTTSSRFRLSRCRSGNQKSPLLYFPPLHLNSLVLVVLLTTAMPPTGSASSESFNDSVLTRLSFLRKRLMFNFLSMLTLCTYRMLNAVGFWGVTSFMALISWWKASSELSFALLHKFARPPNEGLIFLARLE